MQPDRKSRPYRWIQCVVTAFGAFALSLCLGADERSSGERILAAIRYLASDELEGRGIGTEGIELAAEYIHTQFVDAGLGPAMPNGTYFQRFEVAAGHQLGEPNQLALRRSGGQSLQLQLKEDFVPLVFSRSGRFAGPLVFAGYGITAPEYSYDDYAGIDVKGKLVLLMRREPMQDAPAEPDTPFRGSTNTKHAALWSKASNAAEHGAVGIIYVTDPYSLRSEPDRLMAFGYAAGTARSKIPVMHISYAVADSIIGQATGMSLADLAASIDRQLSPLSRVLEGWTASGQITIRRNMVSVANVLGVLDGLAPRSEQTIVIGAHYDHLGYGGHGSARRGVRAIHNGADDNASGTAGLIELARRLAGRATPLRRRILFSAFTAEERGLLGSAHYVDHPVIPLKQTVAMLNLDMIGRLRNEKLIVYGMGTAKEFGTMLDLLGKRHGFDIRGRASGFGPSDQTSFYRKQIPVLHFFTDLHADYHGPTDDWEKVSITGVERVVALVEDVVVELADSPGSPTYVSIARAATPAGGARAYLGTIPSFGSDVDGVLLDGVAPSGPAQTAGLRAGDTIVAVGNMPVHSLEDLQRALVKHKPGQRVRITVRRGTLRISYPATLGKRE